MNKTVNIIGAGLAGCEASYFLANNGVKVNLYEMKSIKKTPAQKIDGFAELVCSNSLKNTDGLTASGLLKLELKSLGCFLLELAYKNAVPSGGALSVDREKFSKEVTSIIKNHKNINVINEIITKIDVTIPTIIATGPLTDDELFADLQNLIGESNCYFYDAIAPIIETDTVDLNYAYWGNRYNKGDGEGDYLNCLLNKDEYLKFYNELINAKSAELKQFEKLKVFEGCMPVEVMAKRGIDALRFGPMKPVGIKDPKKDDKPYAVVQLRKEDSCGTMVNMVGFQTNLTFSEQKRVFSLIPALRNAEFIRYGTMHRNSYINAPLCLNNYSQLKKYPNIFISGQLSGVEGYMESIASGLFCAINMLQYINNNHLVDLPSSTCLGAMINYITSASPENFQPMNSNYGIISFNEEIKDKALKKENIKLKSLQAIDKFKKDINMNI